MSEPFESIRSPNQGLDPTSVLEKSTSILLDVSQSATKALEDIGIFTVFDLATSELFANAVNICLLVEGGEGRFAATGKVPRDALREGHDKPIADLPFQPISILSTHSPKTELDALASAIDITSIRDLAAWPPYRTSRDLLDRAYNPLAISRVLDHEAPPDLVPANGQYPTERVQYEVLLFDQFVGGNGAEPAANPITGALDVSQLLSNDKGYERPAIGGVLTFTQSWYTKGLALGNLIHSVALAPGESTKIAMIDWLRRVQTSATEAIQEDELLTSDLSRARAISEVTRAVARETQQGQSGARSFSESTQYGESSGSAGFRDPSLSPLSLIVGLPISLTAPGVTTSGTSFGTSTGSTFATSWSTSSGIRDIGASLSQDIVDRTHQASHSARNRRASIVREASQQERESISTRTLTNYNHMHALTVEYYEVVQLYRTVVELSKADRCLFVPMKLLDFRDATALDMLRRAVPEVFVGPLVRAGNGIKIQQWDYLGSDNQKWRLTPVGGDYYSITAKHSGKCLDVEGAVGATQDGAKIQQWDYLGSDNQKWRLTPVGGDYYSITAKHSGKCLGLEKGSDSVINGEKIEQKDCENVEPPSETSYSQRWRLDLVDGGWYTITNRNTGKCLDVTGGANNTMDPGRFAIDHFQANRLIYSQAVWRSLDPATVGILLSGYTWPIGGQPKPLIELVDPAPAAIVANYLVFRISGDDSTEYTNWLTANKINLGSRREDLVPVPSGGVFAEAVLGRFNSAEKLDITRFWNWQDSPIPIQAPDIAAIQAGSRRDPDNTVPGQLGAPVLNIVNPPSLPDPQGMGAVLAAIQNGNIFRDMSALAATIGLAQAGLAGTQQGATAAASQAGQNAAVAAELGAKVAELAAQLVAAYFTGGASLAAGAGAGGLAGLAGGISGQGAKINKGRDMDERGVPADTPGVTSAGGGSNGASSADPATADPTTSGPPTSGNEGAAFRTSLGGGPGGIFGQLLNAVLGQVPQAGNQQQGITVSSLTPCINENTTFTLNTGVPAPVQANWSGGGNPSGGIGTTFMTRFGTPGIKQVKAEWSANGGTVSATASVNVRELSGPQWEPRWPGSKDVADLAQPFRGNVESFIAALQAAGATVNISATFRPRERAYLMHYAPRVASANIAPQNVPPEPGVDICWLHRDANGNADYAASRAAAQQLANTFGIVYPAVLQTRHSLRLAIDMTITWNGDLTITDGNGQQVTITSTPRTGADNTDLHAVGATYGVRKLVSDAPHWSDTGN